MTKAEYIAVLRDLLSRDPEKVREANRRLYGAVTLQPDDTDADLALAAAGL